MNHIVSKRIKDGMARDLKKVYKDICKTYGLVVHRKCKSYNNDIWYCSGNGGIVDKYRIRCWNILYFYLIRYIKSVRPRIYTFNRRDIMYHNFRKYYDKGYLTMFNRLPSDMMSEWIMLLKEVKY